MNRNKNFLPVVLAMLAMPAFAQDKNKDRGITNEEVIVVKEYEATIQDAEKVNLQPNVVEVEETKPKLDYSIPGKELKNFAFEASPLKPLSMGKEKLERYNTSYIKLGFGSQIMPLAQVGYNDDKTKDLRFGLFYNHLSAVGFKNKLQRFSDDEVGVYAKYTKALEVGGGFTFRNYRTHFYGTDTSFYGSDTTFRRRDVRQIFRTYDVMLYVKNGQKTKSNINYGQTLNFNFLQETFGKAKEFFVAGNTNFDKSFGKIHTIYANLGFDISRLKNDSLVLNRVIITPTAGYGLNNDDWKGYAHFGVAIDGKRVVFVTNTHLEKRIYMHNFIAFAGYERRYQKNSLNSFIQTNNFIQNSVAIRNSPIDDFKAGVKGTVFNFNYNAAFHLVHIKDFGLFVNDTNDIKRFEVVYDPSTWIYNVHLEAGYNVKEWLRVLAISDINLYDMKAEARPWHEPVLKVTLRANYAWKNKLIVGADIYALTPTFARLNNGTQIKLKGTIDLNLNAEYIFSKHLAFFVAGNNLLNFKYQRWYNYRSYGINGMIGAKYSF